MSNISAEVIDFSEKNVKLFNFLGSQYKDEPDVVLAARQALRHCYSVGKTLIAAKLDLVQAASLLMRKIDPDFNFNVKPYEDKFKQVVSDWNSLKPLLFSTDIKYKSFASFCYEKLNSEQMDAVVRIYNLKNDWDKFKLLQTDNIVSLIHRSRDTENNCDLNGYLQEYLDKKEGETKILYSLEDIAKLCQCSMETLRMGLSHKKLPAPDFVHEGIMLFSEESYYQFNSFLSRLVYNELEENANANNIINNWILKGNNNADN